MKDKRVLTTAIAYANGAPHIGHAFEFVAADTISRYLREKGDDVFFVTGMDEHGQKIQEKAKEKGVPVLDFVNEYAEQFKALDNKLGVVYDYFVRTSDKEKHYKGAQMLWSKLVASGDLEKRTYTALYCVGCEEFKTEKDLNEKGECPIHLKKPEAVEEENYFFKLSKYSSQIKQKIENNEMEIVPQSRKNEILALIDRGLEDVSFSRPVSKVSWGIPVPGDDSQVMYVWCDALSNYITALGYGTDSFDEERWENATHIIGKDILRFHAAIWPGMLLSAGLSLPKKILVHGFITSGGHKMSKSLGNVIDPQEVLAMFKEPAGELAGEALRFILLHEIPSFDDGDLTMDSIKIAYKAYLQDGIGNFTSRVMKMAISNNLDINSYMKIWGEKMSDTDEYNKSYHQAFDSFNANKAVGVVMSQLRWLDGSIQSTEPFKVIKIDSKKGGDMILNFVKQLAEIAHTLAPILPSTSAKILECIRENKMPEKPLFGRLS